MLHYYKTSQGNAALKNRQFNLNVRQRRLLLLIGTDDFNHLNDQLRQKIAPLELLAQLEEMGLITHPEAVQSSASSVSYLSSQQPDALVSTPMTLKQKTRKEQLAESEVFNAEKQSVRSQESGLERPTSLGFNDIKLLMSETLSCYCGLLARQLLDQINNATNIEQLKLCQMQWITALQESRIPSQLLSQQLQKINFSIKNISFNHEDTIYFE